LEIVLTIAVRWRQASRLEPLECDSTARRWRAGARIRIRPSTDGAAERGVSDRPAPAGRHPTEGDQGRAGTTRAPWDGGPGSSMATPRPGGIDRVAAEAPAASPRPNGPNQTSPPRNSRLRLSSDSFDPFHTTTSRWILHPNRRRRRARAGRDMTPDADVRRRRHARSVPHAPPRVAPEPSGLSQHPCHSSTDVSDPGTPRLE
jgi:hypothetical protein